MKTWLITGASSGLGYATTEKLLKDGHQVIACGRSLERLAFLSEAYSGRLHLVYLDVECTQSISDVVSFAFSVVERVDVVMSGAGYGVFGAVEEVSLDILERLLKVNLLGSIVFLRACLPFLRAQRSGFLLQISSEVGEVSFPALSVYQASKWGIEGFCEGLRQEVSCFGLDLTIVVPGRVATRFDESTEVSINTILDYQRTTVGNYRRLLALGKFPCPGDVGKMASSIIACADSLNPPKRLILGSDSFKNIKKALIQRLEELAEQRESAAATDKG